MKAVNDNNDRLRVLSVCSGIEAASVAFGPLGWEVVAFSEIEKFPSALLAHRYPEVPNLGDFTTINTATLGRIDILCGGPPCQAFSIAGLRGGLNDARGNLTLSFVRLAHELAGISASPKHDGSVCSGNGLRNIIYENVPGILSDRTNAFGCFLGALVGADDAVIPSPQPGERQSDAHWRWNAKSGTHSLKWPDAGMVDGPKGRAAWRILDAQYFGLAQRRKRVIVVADFGNGADPAAVLFERASLQGNTPPSREARKDVAPTISARTKGGGRLGTDFDLDGGLVEAVASGGYAPEIARCVATREGSSQDYESTTIVVAGTLTTTYGEQSGQDMMAENMLVIGHDRPVAYSIMPQNSGKDYKARVVDVAQPLMAAGPAGGNQGGDYIVEPTAFDTTQITSAENRSNPQPGDPCHPLSAQAHPPAICFTAKDYGADASEEISPTLRAGGFTGSHANGGVMPAVTVAIRGREGGGTAELGGEVATALRASQGGGDKPHVLTSAVRRLTPTECERLMGFPDGYTDIPWRGKPTSPDGPRYKALGNSWAVPKFAWLGRRIQRLMPLNSEAA